MQSYRHRGWALKMWARGPDEQRCRFLIYWVGLSAAGTAALCMALHTACSQTRGDPLSRACAGTAWLGSAAPCSTKRCGEAVLPDSPKARSKMASAACTPASTAGDVNGLHMRAKVCRI